ncbi:52 kDa repressor of the inhibitor of the protein kinase-like [Syngnathoides biaculeatus]|uniref:52 kDa repressor of the inhibitor of the protein kinase-like n=1 Tax=Syngnathoides biaculeatus TaxID=300417 RepID=UPI002ADD7D36|nr:52 kDa repressor of the inhibitor of the protein kinase-like [Syngnathoides biaculeatus]
MPDFCCVNGCGNRGNRDIGKRFFRVPKIRLHEGEGTMELSKKRQQKWLANIQRADLNEARVHKANGYLKVCSDHFVSGEPSKLYDKDSVDWAPTVKLGHNNVNCPREADLQRTERMNQRVEKRKYSEAAEILLKLNKRPDILRTSDESCETSNHHAVDNNSNHVSCQTNITMDNIDEMERELGLLKRIFKKNKC